MITVRRREDRLHHKNDSGDAWCTFFPRTPAGALDHGFCALESLLESRLAPGGRLQAYPRRNAEIVTFVREGALAWEDSSGGSGVLQAGEFRRMTSGLDLRHRDTNASTIHEAHVFQIGLRPAQAELESSHEYRRFSTGHRRGALCLVASADGRRGALTLRLDAMVFSALLDPGTHIAHALAPGRSAWLHIVLGQARLGEVVLGAGDGAGLGSELAVSLIAQERTEILLMDLGPPAPTLAVFDFPVSPPPAWSP